MAKLERVFILIIEFIPIFLVAVISILLFGLLVDRSGQIGSAAAAIVGTIIGAAITAVSMFLVSRHDRYHQLRMAAVERRLKAHQDAFFHWSKLVANVYRPEISDIVMECQNWWYANCLYLEGDARKAFRLAYMSANDHATYVKYQYDSEFLRKNFETIMSAGNIILESVMLPPIRDMASEFGIDNKSFQDSTTSSFK